MNLFNFGDLFTCTRAELLACVRLRSGNQTHLLLELKQLRIGSRIASGCLESLEVAGEPVA